MTALDERQRYRVPEACELLRISKAYFYRKVRDKKVVIIKDGTRTFVSGSEIARLSRAAGSET